MIGKAVTLEKCMEYYGVMERYMIPSLEKGVGEDLLCTKIFSADEYVAFMDMSYERELKTLERMITDPTNDKKNIEGRINYVMGCREEDKKKYYEVFTNSELQEKAPAELERRKRVNKEILRNYGIEL